jgi:hypothetical protein
MIAPFSVVVSDCDSEQALRNVSEKISKIIVGGFLIFSISISLGRSPRLPVNHFYEGLSFPHAFSATGLQTDQLQAEAGIQANFGPVCVLRTGRLDPRLKRSGVTT